MKEFNFELINKWYVCPSCKLAIPYNTSTCPGCHVELGWRGKTENSIPYLVPAKTFVIEVKGESHINDDGTSRQDIIRRCQIGEPINLIHEPHPQDKNAIKVCRLNGEQLGYIPKYASAEFADIIKRGIKQDVKIADIKVGEYTGCWLKIIRYEDDQNISPQIGNHLEKTVKTDTYIFCVERIVGQELAKCRTGDYVNLWVSKDDSYQIHIFRSGTIGGMGRLGFVSHEYSGIISAHLRNGLKYETEIVEVDIAKLQCRIKCRLISPEETAAKNAADAEIAANRLKAELQKKFTPKNYLSIRVQLPKNHALKIGQQLFLEKQPLEYYLRSALALQINFVDNREIIVAHKSNEPQLTRTILRAFFNNHVMRFSITSIEMPDQYTMNYVDTVEAKVEVSFEKDI